MRRSSLFNIIAVACLLYGVAALRLSPRPSSALAAQAQTAPKNTAQLHPASATVAEAVKPADIPPAKSSVVGPTDIYTAKRGESIPAVARQFLHQTSYLTSSELADAIRKVNGNRTGNILKNGEQITIPGILPEPIVEKTVPIARDFEVRAIYLTGIMAASDHGLRIIRHWREVGGNAVVFDIKDSDGSVTIPFEHPLLGKHQVYIHDLPKFVHFLHSENMHAIARIAIFRDERLVVEHPELAVKSKRTGQPWRENGKLVWTDPSQPKVQEYDIALAKFVAQSGADEIQFDYVRFPAEGDQKDAGFVFQSGTCAEKNDVPCGDGRPSASSGQALARPAEAKQGGTITADAAADAEPTPGNSDPKHPDSKHHGAKHVAAAKHPEAAPAGPQRSDVITGFLKKAYGELHPTGVLLSLDVFGVMAWQRSVDLSHTGQDIVGMAKYCDVLSPMIYPSHFFGMDNIAHPGDAPEHFIGESMERFELITHPDGNRSSGVVIRPWLQAFHWRTKTYSPEYIKVQVATAKEKGGIGFLFWNAANDYSKPYEAMPEMKAAKEKYFRGDELPAVTVKASLTPAAVPAPAVASH
ncbi:MAG: putative glycoside hydrolase [Candidatus Sulfotelmatobacter sp.]